LTHREVADIGTDAFDTADAATALSFEAIEVAVATRRTSGCDALVVFVAAVVFAGTIDIEQALYTDIVLRTTAAFIRATSRTAGHIGCAPSICLTFVALFGRFFALVIQTFVATGTIAVCDTLVALIILANTLVGGARSS
jgi:hypothetical protein